MIQNSIKCHEIYYQVSSQCLVRDFVHFSLQCEFLKRTIWKDQTHRLFNIDQVLYRWLEDGKSLLIILTIPRAPGLQFGWMFRKTAASKPPTVWKIWSSFWHMFLPNTMFWFCDPVSIWLCMVLQANWIVFRSPFTWRSEIWDLLPPQIKLQVCITNFYSWSQTVTVCFPKHAAVYFLSGQGRLPNKC